MKEMDKVGIMLAQGLTKKEIAIRTGKSVCTINAQARKLYERTGSRNLADITRWVISQHCGISVDKVLIKALNDITQAA